MGLPLSPGLAPVHGQMLVIASSLSVSAHIVWSMSYRTMLPIVSMHSVTGLWKWRLSTGDRDSVVRKLESQMTCSVKLSSVDEEVT